MPDARSAQMFQERIHCGDLPAIVEMVRADHELLNARDAQGRTTLHLALDADAGDRLALIAFLLAEGAPTDGADNRGWTPLHHAAASGQIEAMRLLLQDRADANARDHHGVTPLHCAAVATHEEHVALLIEHGARVDAPDSGGKTPIVWALADGHIATARFLWDRGASRTPFAAAGLGEVQWLREQADKQPEVVQSRDGRGNSPLHWAAWNGQSAAADFLLKRGAEVDAQNREGMSALHVGAFRYADAATIQLLLDHGASTELRDKKGRTPLHYAALKASLAKAVLLIRYGAGPNPTDLEQQTPLDLLFSRYSLSFGSTEQAELSIARHRRLVSGGGADVFELLCSQGGTLGSEQKQARG